MVGIESPVVDIGTSTYKHILNLTPHFEISLKKYLVYLPKETVTKTKNKHKQTNKKQVKKIDQVLSHR